MFKRFAKDESGNIITVLGLSTLTLLGAVSASLDYTRMSNTRTALGAAVDAAALAAAQAPQENAATLARQVFDANFRGSQAVTAFSAEPFTRDGDAAYRVEATVDVPMSLTRIMGADKKQVRSISEVLAGADHDVQLALVLDVTGSMMGAKLANLKASASAMVNAVYDKLSRPGQLKIAVVPFADYVNVGLSNRNQPWMSVPPDSTSTNDVCWTVADPVSTYNCRDEPRSWTTCNDGACTTQTWTVQVCDHEWGPAYQVCDRQTQVSQWNGCAGSRDYPLNVRDENYLARPAPGAMNVTCPPQITPLSASRSPVLGAINNLVADGDTYIPSGLMWGWAALSPIDPFNETANSARTTKRHLILMTDGENTRSPTYPNHNGSNPALADTLTAELCANVKADGIEIFTVAFEVNSNVTKNMLRNCASSASKYFDAADASQLASAFENIGQQMANLRIIR